MCPLRMSRGVGCVWRRVRQIVIQMRLAPGKSDGGGNNRNTRKLPLDGYSPHPWPLERRSETAPLFKGDFVDASMGRIRCTVEFCRRWVKILSREFFGGEQHSSFARVLRRRLSHPTPVKCLIELQLLESLNDEPTSTVGGAAVSTRMKKHHSPGKRNNGLADRGECPSRQHDGGATVGQLAPLVQESEDAGVVLQRPLVRPDELVYSVKPQVQDAQEAAQADAPH